MVALIFQSAPRRYALYALTTWLVVLCAVNLSIIVSRTSTQTKHSKSYSYVGDDYPEFWEVDAPPLAMVIEETVHYPIAGPDAREEWASNYARGFGYIRLGPEHRAFALSMFHQMHCWRLIRSGLGGDRRPGMEGHIRHCLNYIRQMVLCSPDLTLEPPNVLTKDFETERVGGVHVCKNWPRIYEEASANWDEWEKVQPSFEQAFASPSLVL